MRFNPTAPPYWEIERGGGPCTEWQRRRERSSAMAALEALEDERELLKAAGAKSKDVVLLDLAIAKLRAKLGLRPRRKKVRHGPGDRAE